ncbi:transcription factor E2F7 [Takifugu rubripes]|nr:transcription factor E2F7 [Takifugu rubripes]
MEVECLSLKDLTSPRKSFQVHLEEEDGSEQKENICRERRRSSPMKSDASHVTPVKHQPLPEPWTPTANLKMLISVASPDIREREKKKVLFTLRENDGDTATRADFAEVEEPAQFEAEEEEEEDAEKKPSRKQKSLGLLCQKFLALYPDYPPPHSPIWISLDEVATNLGVERRRIYDIVNVLESLMIVGRIAKNCYTWYGRQRLEGTLEELQQRGRKQGYHLHMELGLEATEGSLGREDDGAEGDSGNAAGNRKDKSLRIMSQKFVMLFLVSKTQTVTLDTAAKVLIEDSQDSSSHSKYKTKVRRLYDIANVLTSLNLIKKVHVREERGRKPAFKWLGPVEFTRSATAGSTVGVATIALPVAAQPSAEKDPRKAKITRHASFNSAPAPASVQRQVNSAPCSPRPEMRSLLNQAVDYSRRTSHGTVCAPPFGNGTEICPTATLQTPSRGGSNPTLLVPALHGEHPLLASSAPHCLAYLPALSQASVVMLYRQDRAAEGQRSPSVDCGKRKRADEEEALVSKRHPSGAKECDMNKAEGEECSQTTSARERGPSEGPGELPQTSHYLYIPNNAGLNGVNLLIPAGQPPAGMGLNPTLAVPYVVLPSAALSHYPLVAGGLPQQLSDAQSSHNKLSFSLPSVMPPFMVGAVPYNIAAGSERSSVPSPATPEHSRVQGSLTGTPNSPSGPHQTVNISTPEPLTPNDATSSFSKAFFRTPGTLGSAAVTVPAARKRGSVQRRLDVGHPPTS